MSKRKEEYYPEHMHKWVAKIKKSGYTHDAESLLRILKAAIESDLESIGYKLWGARNDAKEAFEIADKALKDTGSEWSKR